MSRKKVILACATLLLFAYLVLSFKNFTTNHSPVSLEIKDWGMLPQKNTSSPQHYLSEIFKSHPPLKRYVQSHETWPYMKNIQLYTDNMVIDTGKKSRIYFALGLMGQGAYISKVSISNALTNKPVDEVSFQKSTQPLRFQSCDSYYAGCNFTNFFELDLTPYRKNKALFVTVQDEKGQSSEPVFFYFKDESQDKVAIVLPNYTWQAYNYAGGGSFYGTHFSKLSIKDLFSKLKQMLIRLDIFSMLKFIYHGGYMGYTKIINKYDTFVVSMERPVYFSIHSETEFAHSPRGSIEFAKILEKMNVPWHFVSNSEFDENRKALEGTKLLIINSHDEYWTPEIFRQIKEFQLSGGRIANFSGNLAHRQINSIKQKLYVWQGNNEYKDLIADSIFSKTGPIDFPNVNQSITSMACVWFKYGGYPVKDIMGEERAAKEYNIAADQYKSSSGLKVKDNSHPIFTGINIKNGEYIGVKTEVIGMEVDGIILNDGQTAVSPKISKMIPRHRILGTALAYKGDDLPWKGINEIGILVECEPNGLDDRVISFGSINVTLSLSRRDGDIELLVENTVRYLLSNSLESLE